MCIQSVSCVCVIFDRKSRIAVTNIHEYFFMQSKTRDIKGHPVYYSKMFVLRSVRYNIAVPAIK